MACYKVNTGARCYCKGKKGPGKFAKMTKCKGKGFGGKKHAKRSVSKKACVPGTHKVITMGKAGKRCSCKTRGGGYVLKPDTTCVRKGLMEPKAKKSRKSKGMDSRSYWSSNAQDTSTYD